MTTSQKPIIHARDHDIGGADPVIRRFIVTWAGVTPADPGPGLVARIPWVADMPGGGIGATFYIALAFVRLEAASTGTDLIIESSPGVGAFTGTTIATLAIASGDYEGSVADLATTVESTDLLRPSWTTFGVPAGTAYTIQVNGTTR